MITIKQGDTYPPLRAYLQMVTGKPIRLADATVRLIVKDANNVNRIDRSVSIVDEEKGYIEYRWRITDTNVPGIYKGEFEVTQQDGSIVTVPNDGYFTVNITNELG